jgi:hypothetical protein
LAKSVRVHEDTHAALKRLKAQKRAASLDQVIREAIREAMAAAEEGEAGRGRTERLTSYTGE